MAKNYTLKEAVEVMVIGKDIDSMNDICRRYPAFACMAIKLGALAGEDFIKFASFIPEYITANKFCKEMKKENSDEISEEIEETEEIEEAVKEEVVEEKPKKGKAKKEENPYKGMTAVELFKECKKKGIKAEAKKPAKYYIELLTAPVEEETEDDDWGDEEEEAPKKPAKTSKAKPAKKAEPVEDDDDEDWDI